MRACLLTIVLFHCAKPLDIEPDTGPVDAATEAAVVKDAAPDVAKDAPFDAGDLDAGLDAAPDSDCPQTTTGALGIFDFTGAAGNQTSTTSSSVVPGVTIGFISRAAGLTAVAGTNSINSSNWGTTSSVDKTKYYTFSVTPDPKCKLDLTSLTINTQASGTGPTAVATGTSVDSFGAATTFTIGGSATATLSVTDATSAIEVRIYGYGASGTAGTLRINNTLTINGALK